MARKPIHAEAVEMDEFLKAHTVATAMTDFDGKATVAITPPGAYFVFCVFELGDKFTRLECSGSAEGWEEYHRA